jgi:hypothetical protein
MENVGLKKNMVLGILLFAIIQGIQSQHFEAGGSIGTLQYEGDIGGRTSGLNGLLQNKTSRASLFGSLEFGYSPVRFIQIRLSVLTGSVQAADSLLNQATQKETIKKTRNLHFRSPIKEASLLFAVHPFDFTYSELIWIRKFSPYLLFGAGFFEFNPMGWYQNPTGPDGWVALKPLRTEGQGMATYPDRPEYALRALNFQAGAGIRYLISSKITVAVEILNRKTNTDYLDDVSTRYIDNNAFDAYFGTATKLAETAKQLANNPAFKNAGNYINGFSPGSVRGSPASKDYYYGTYLRIGYRLGSGLDESMQRSRMVMLDCFRF